MSEKKREFALASIDEAALGLNPLAWGIFGIPVGLGQNGYELFLIAKKVKSPKGIQARVESDSLLVYVPTFVYDSSRLSS